MRSGRLTVAVIIATAPLAACGSSKKPTAHTSTNGHSTKIDAPFIARINAVCAAATKGAPPFPYANFDPLRPDVKLLPKVGAFFAKRQAVSDAIPGQLARLGQPATGAANWNHMVALARRDRAIADRQIKAAEASNVTEFVATVKAVGGISMQLRQLADAAGIPASSPCRMVF
jgi:hypothetical protein